MISPYKVSKPQLAALMALAVDPGRHVYHSDYNREDSVLRPGSDGKGFETAAPDVSAASVKKLIALGLVEPMPGHSRSRYVISERGRMVVADYHARSPLYAEVLAEWAAKQEAMDAKRRRWAWQEKFGEARDAVDLAESAVLQEIRKASYGFSPDVYAALHELHKADAHAKTVIDERPEEE